MSAYVEIIDRPRVDPRCRDHGIVDLAALALRAVLDRDREPTFATDLDRGDDGLARRGFATDRHAELHELDGHVRDRGRIAIELRVRRARLGRCRSSEREQEGGRRASHFINIVPADAPAFGLGCARKCFATGGRNP